MRPNVPECKKTQVERTVQKAKEILMGDEFSVIILLFWIAF